MRLLVTRPEQDAATLQRELVSRGHEVMLEPLLQVRFEPVEVDDVVGAQALIATSKNGLRSLAQSPAMGAARTLPMFTVGPGTAATAKALGFQIVIQGPKTARELVPVIGAMSEVNAGPLVHLAGDVLAFDLAGELQRLGFHVLQPVVYVTEAVRRLGAQTVRAIDNNRIDGVILLSPQTARIYRRLIAQHGLDHANERVIHFCLSDAVARECGTGEAAVVKVADHPNLEEMLALVGAGTAH